MEIRSGKKSVEKRYGFRSSGNVNHARYDHKQRAREIHVLCPKCKHMAQAVDVEAALNQVIVGDLSPSWKSKPFTLACTKCSFTAEGLSYAELPKPYHYIEAKEDVLWAYNWRHLDMIKKALEGLSVAGHPYEFFATYIHGNWKKNSKFWLLGINEHVKQSDSRHQFSSKYHQLKSVT
ncbi:hypothetical protein IB232_09135 [Pseudomonas sp. PDM15]|uniref:hypothetical protein n=1 Tax=Pseudomonas sp. PDM15 TaxID=2769303 RepID=UPI00177F3FA9|nr:hypothetical protein [Pseudomonas sp. PDM15]MBD9425480.1 hypothetical protein [Pseudomonas sp. PDM15]